MRCSLRRFCLVATALLPLSAWAGTAVPFTINLSKAVNVVTSGGTPRIAVDVAGTTRYANYTSGSGTSALVFTYQMQAGDVDLDGVAVSSPVQLNGGTIKDLSGNPLTNLTFTPPNTAGIKVNYPSLGMDFTNGAGGRYTLNGTPYTTLASFLTAAGGSFTRASVGTYFDSAGVLQTASANTPRLDYDPVTHAAKGILIEEQRTNLALRSAQLDASGAYWGSFRNSITPNAITAPDGTTTAELFTVTANGYSYANKSLNAQNMTLSAYFKAGTTSLVSVDPSGNNNNDPVVFDLSTGTVQYFGSNNVSATIQPAGNGWYRCAVYRTTATSGEVYIGKFGASIGDTYYLWGAQLEQGAFPTSYIPTTTAAVTRQADDLYISGSGFLSAYSGTEGTLFSDLSVEEGSAFRMNATPILYNSASPNSDYVITLLGTGSFMRTLAHSGATQPVDLIAGAYPALPVSFKYATAFKLNDYAVSYNGNAPLFDTSAVVPSMNSLGIGGQRSTASQNLSGVFHAKKVKFYPARVPNTQLQRMTQ